MILKSSPLSIVTLGTQPLALELTVFIPDLNSNSPQQPLCMRVCRDREADLRQKNIYVLGETGQCKAWWSGQRLGWARKSTGNMPRWQVLF